MKHNLWSRLLSLCGWKALIPNTPAIKSVICVAPHTSNWDLPLGLLYYLSIGRKPHFMIKKEWFFFPFNLLFKAIGGVAIDRSKNSSVVDQMIALFKTKKEYNIAVTPEGSRSKRDKWRTGFWRIASGAGIMIELACIDYKRREIGIFEQYTTTDNLEADLAYIRSRYHADMAKFPEKYTE